jgi:hypothetical protein
MPRKTNTRGVLYRIEPEYNRGDNGIWHAVEVADTGNARDVGQAERLDRDRPLAERWRPLRVTVERSRRGGDFFQLETFHWATTAAAVKALRPLLRGRVEILPLKVIADYEEDEDYDFDELPARPKLRERYPRLFALHPLGRVHLGTGAEVTYFLDDPDIIDEVERYVFRPADLEGRHFFRIRGADLVYLASEEFRQAVQRHNLRGLKFHPVRHEVEDSPPKPARGGRAGAARTGRRNTRGRS